MYYVSHVLLYINVCKWSMNACTLLHLSFYDRQGQLHSTEGLTPALAGGREAGASRAEATLSVLKKYTTGSPTNPGRPKHEA